MCDISKRKSSGFCRSKNKLRTVTTTKWELPLPGSKSYWDKICDDLEQRKEHVSDFSYPSSPSPNAINDPNQLLINDESTLSKLSYIVEPIVKISPPTPMRMIPRNRRFTMTDNLVVDENDAESENNENGLTGSHLPYGLSPIGVDEKKDAKLYEISVCMTEFLKSNGVQTKKSCQLHKNAPPLKIFDDNLKRFLPEKKITFKLPGTKMQSMLQSDVLDISNLHRNKSCPFRRQPVSKDLMDFGISLTENKNKVSPPLRRSKTEGPRKRKVKSSLDQFLTVPKSPYVNVRFDSKYQTLNKKSKSKVLNSNLNYMLNIPKLNDIDMDQNLFKSSDNTSSKEAAANLDSQQKIQSVSHEHSVQMSSFHSQGVDESEFELLHLHSSGLDEEFREHSTNENTIPKLTENSKPSSNIMNLPRLSEELSTALDEQTINNEQGASKSRISSVKLHQGQPEKDFLKVPKLGAISSYPSFSKLTPGDSVDGLTGNMVPQNLENFAQQTDPCKRDFLKVPKLSMMSSYPSFTSLIPESLDSDDNTTSTPDLIPKPNTPPSTNDERSADYNESTDPVTTRDKEASPSVNFSLMGKPKRRQSLKDSVRYAYRALKFITPNKNLDFQPQSYHPPKKSGSSTGSSGSSCDSKYSKFEPAIKLLTYEDVNRERPPIRSASSSTYGTVRSRLKQNASQYLGSDYVFSSSKDRATTASTTIPSLTRSTSGPTLDFQEPVFERPSQKVLSKLPKMSIFPRKKYDKCFACLHKAFEEPIKYRRELPLATLNAVVKETVRMLSESESSSISLPDVTEFIESQSDYEDNWTDVLKSTKKSMLLDKTEWKTSKGLLRTNIDAYRARPPLARASEESQSLKSDGKIENLQKNLSSKDSIASNTHPRPLSLSSEHSKPSSQSGHSSESEEPQVQIKPAVPTSECFVSPYAPLYWAPSLDPLKSLKFRKPVSMHGRAASITKTEDDSTSDDNANDYRSTRKETKARKVTDETSDGPNVNSSAKPGMKSSEKSNLMKQPSIVAKIITSQLSTVANLTKKQSRVDLLSNNSKGDNLTGSVPDVGEKVSKETIVQSQTVEANFQDDFNDDSNQRCVEAQPVGRSVTRSPLSEITEQLIESGSPMNKGVSQDSEKPLLNENSRSVSGTNISTEFQEDEGQVDESQDRDRKASQIYSSERVVEVLEKCIEEERTPFEMLEALNDVATRNDPFTSKETSTGNPEIARSATIAKNLIKLLIDSKKYLHPDTFSPHLQFSSQQIPLCNPRQLRRVLPTKTYNLVARILGMPENPVEKSIDQKTDFKSGHQAKDPFKLRQTRNRGQVADSCDMIVHPPSSRGGRRPVIDEDDFEYPQQSPYALFMEKPRRKAIKWRPLTERDMLGYDPEATLNMRATRVTNKICEDFCEWLRGLGGGHGDDIDEEVLKDMFQIEFTAEACRTMQVLIKEIPMVPIAVALARNTPGAGELALTRRHLIRDAKAESMPKKIIGFGSMLPQDRRFLPPNNHVDERWLQCESVPQDLETMETVWKGITHLDSVKGFLAWVKAHPGVKPPKILTEAYVKKEALVRQPSIEEASGQIELEMDQIESLKVGDVE